MRLQVATIGRLKTGPEKMLAQDYQSRIELVGRQAGISKFMLAEFAESQAQATLQRQAEEARHLTSAVAARSFTIALDERGKSLTSPELAKLLQQHLAHATPQVDFLIGGPDGHAPAIRSGAGLLLSFGQMTWPHRLVRIMLLEQIYRAITILLNHPYHRV